MHRMMGTAALLGRTICSNDFFVYIPYMGLEHIGIWDIQQVSIHENR